MRSPGLATFALVGASLVASCTCSEPSRTLQPRPPSPLTSALGTALRVAAGDLDGDGLDEIVGVDAELVRVLDRDGNELGRALAPGGIQVLLTSDLERNGKHLILAGFGRTAERRESGASVVVYRLSAGKLLAEPVLEPQSERPEIAALVPQPDAGSSIVVAHFTSKYFVRFDEGHRRDGRWSFRTLATIRMATAVAAGDIDGDGRPDLVVGRMYGDTPSSQGNAFVLRPDGTRVPIPIVGGVRSLAVADLDGDGRSDVLLGDGWDADYGKNARAFLTRARFTAGVFRTERVEHDAEQYALERIFASDVDGDGGPEIVARGNAHLRVLRREKDGWRGVTLARNCRDAIALDLDDRAGRELLALCDGAARVFVMPTGT